MQLTEDDWVDRFVLRLVMIHGFRAHPELLTQQGHAWWPELRELTPESAVDSIANRLEDRTVPELADATLARRRANVRPQRSVDDSFEGGGSVPW